MMQVFRVGDWRFDGRTNRIYGETSEIELEPQLGQLLLYLIARKGEVLSRDQLIHEAWPGIVSDAAINQAIAKLRKILGDDARAAKYVETIPKKGYRFIASVSEVTEKTESPQAVDVARADVPETKIAAPVADIKRPASISILTAFVTLFALTLVYYLISSFFLQSDTPERFVRTTPVTSMNGLEVNLAIHPQSRAKVFSHKPAGARRYDLVLQNAEQRAPVFLTQTPDITELQPAWSPDGKHLAYIAHSAKGCEVMLAQETDPEQAFSAKPVTACSAFDIQLAWHPDNKRLFFNRRGHRDGPLKVFAYHLDDGRLQEITSVREGITGDVAFTVSADGSTLAVSRTFHWNQSTIWLIDLQSGEEKQLVQLPYWIKALEFTLDGQSLLFVEAPLYRHIRSVNIADGRLDTLYTSTDTLEEPFITAQDELYFSRHQFNTNIDRIDNPLVSTELNRQTVVNSSQQDWHPRLSGDEQLLAFLSDRSGNIEIWLKQLNQQNETQLSHFEGLLTPVRMDWKSDNSLVFDTTDNQLYELNVVTGKLDKLSEDNTPARNPNHSQGKIIYSHYQQGKWQVNKGLPGLSEEFGDVEMFSVKRSESAALPGWIYTKFYQSGFWYLGPDKEQVRLTENGSQGPFNQWHLSDSGLYYLASEGPGPALFYYQFSDGSNRKLLSFPSRELVGFDLSKDQNHIYLAWLTQHNADIWQAK